MNKKFGNSISNNINITKIDQNNYKENDIMTKRKEDMSDRDWKIFRENFNIIVKGDKNIPIRPIRSWKEASISKELLHIIEKLYSMPTSIQMQAIPIGIERQDLIAVSPTGSGKSIAFLLPIINFLLNSKLMINTRIEGPQAIIIAPTRELAQQIEEEFYKLTRKLSQKLKSVCLVGQKSIEDQFSIIS